MKRARKILATPLWHLCGLVDRLPRYDRETHRWYANGCLGCFPLRLGTLAWRIEDPKS